MKLLPSTKTDFVALLAGAAWGYIHMGVLRDSKVGRSIGLESRKKSAGAAVSLIQLGGALIGGVTWLQLANVCWPEEQAQLPAAPGADNGPLPPAAASAPQAAPADDEAL
jgi:hypothetical protein